MTGEQDMILHDQKPTDKQATKATSPEKKATKKGLIVAVFILELSWSF